jgi:FMN reductase
MTRTLKVVAVSGSLNHPSKTTALVEEIVAALGRALPIESHAGALTRSQLPPLAEAELQRIETADLLVVASPVYRASFTGLFKHLFDFIDQYALVDTPVLLAASGGSERHALIIEHQFRPLFAFFQALTLPVGIYAHDSDFTDYRLTNETLRARIEKAVAKAVPVIWSNLEEKDEIVRALDGESVSTQAE